MIFLFIGCILFGFGLVFKLFPAKKINLIYGYQSYLARKNQQNWRQAQKLFSNFALMIGGATALIGYLLKQTGRTNFFIIEMLLIVLPVIAVFALTEDYLQKFDQARSADDENLDD